MAVRMCLLDIGVHWLESPWSICLSGAERLGQGPSAAVSPGTGTGRHAEHCLSCFCKEIVSSSWHPRPQGQGHAVSLNLLRPLVTHGGYLTCWGAEIFTVGLSSVTKNQSHRTQSMHRIQLQALNLTVTSPASPTHFLPMWPS